MQRDTIRKIDKPDIDLSSPLICHRDSPALGEQRIPATSKMLVSKRAASREYQRLGSWTSARGLASALIDSELLSPGCDSPVQEDGVLFDQK
ncbi:hypothetical protein DPSP01_001614 [Paraphaeosphaeria sporulosa]